MDKKHAAADVVWLTKNCYPNKEKLLQSSIVDKTKIRITVDVPTQSDLRGSDKYPLSLNLSKHDIAIPYLQWAKKHKVSRNVINALNKAGGYQAKYWYVYEQVIPKSMWVAVERFEPEE